MKELGAYARTIAASSDPKQIERWLGEIVAEAVGREREGCAIVCAEAIRLLGEVDVAGSDCCGMASTAVAQDIGLAILARGTSPE